MRKYLFSALFILAPVVFVVPGCNRAAKQVPQAGATGAQTIPRTPDGKPDLHGGWIQMRRNPKFNHNKAHTNALTSRFTKEPMPLTPYAEERCQQIPLKCANQGGEQEEGDDETRDIFTASNDWADPVVSRCAPAGFPRMLLSVEPMEIMQTRERYLMRFEQYESAIREIWMDGRGHPENPDRPWLGHSIGKWDGDTLVVDTVGPFMEMTWFDRIGHPHGENLHVVERITRPEYDVLKIDLAFDDPKVFTRPFTGQATYEFRPGQEIREAVVCEDRILGEKPEDSWPFHATDGFSLFTPSAGFKYSQSKSAKGSTPVRK